MSVAIDSVFSRGGRDLVNLLEFCVLSVNKDALFLYLSREYRLQPSANCAFGLYDMFCAANAPARISVDGMLPPKDWRLAELLSANRPPKNPPRDDSAIEEDGALQDVPPRWLPPRYIFDSLTQQLATSSAAVARLEQSYNAELTPHENLPGGKLTSGQRAWVEYTWTPIVRPTLVGAGFWRIAAIG